MISNFERDTVRLSGYEKNELMPAVIEKLKTCVGKRKVITNKKLIRQHLGYYVVDPARLRKVINYIRNNNLISGLVATSRGYYIAENREELEQYVKSLQGRIAAITTIRNSVMQQMDELFPTEQKNQKEEDHE